MIDGHNLEGALSGLLFGISNGVAPGPLALLTISETLRAGQRAGIKIACSPLVSDLLIVPLALGVFAWFARQELFLAMISGLGALFLVFLAAKSWQPPSSLTEGLAGAQPGGFGKAVLLNIFSPYPYLFWLTVGFPFLVDVGADNLVGVVGFFVMFYGGLLGAKILLVVASAHGKRLFDPGRYGLLLRVIALVLLGFAVRLAVASYRYLAASVV